MYCRSRSRNSVIFLLFFKHVLKRVNNNMLISVYRLMCYKWMMVSYYVESG